MKEQEVKMATLKNILDFLKGEEKASWKDVLEEGGEPAKEEAESEDEEECDCEEGESCPICGKPKGIVVEEVSVGMIPKKK